MTNTYDDLSWAVSTCSAAAKGIKQNEIRLARRLRSAKQRAAKYKREDAWKKSMRNEWRKDKIRKLRSELLTYNPEREAAHSFRVHVLRPKLRAMYLAKGFLNYTPYKTIENDSKSEPDWLQVHDLVMMYGHGDTQKLSAEFTAWRYGQAK